MTELSSSSNTGLSLRVLDDIRKTAMKFAVGKVVLFGSRARGTHDKKSDIDLAVYGCERFPEFCLAVEEQVWTLLEFDLIDMECPAVSEELLKEIEKDGVVIYEKV